MALALNFQLADNRNSSYDRILTLLVSLAKYGVQYCCCYLDKCCTYLITCVIITLDSKKNPPLDGSDVPLTALTVCHF